MAAINTSAVSDWLMRRYSQKRFFKPYQNDLLPTYEDIDQQCPDEAPDGSGWFVPLYIASSQNWRAGAEGGVTSDVAASTETQGSVNAQEFKGTVQLTEFLKRAGSARGHFNGGALAHQMDMLTTDVMKGCQRFIVVGHGTGRLAVVDAATVATNSFVCRLPLAHLVLAINMRIDFVDTDTGGTVQGTANHKITAIDRTTRGITGGGAFNTFAGTVTFDGVAESLTAGWGVYRSGDYGGNIINGIRGLVQNGDVSSSFLGKTYASFPGLKAQVLSNSGTPRPLTESLMRQMADEIYHAGGEIEDIRCNTGVMNAVGALQTGDKRYSIVRGEFPKYITGWREGDLLFAYDKATAVIKKDPNIPARELYFLCLKDSFYKHTLADFQFMGGGKDGVLHLTPNATTPGGGFETSWTAVIYAALNISNYYPPKNGVIRDLEDATLAGD